MTRCTDIFYAEYMPKVIQLRQVPEQMHSRLKARAAREGMSLSGFIKRQLQRTVGRPSLREWLERTQKAKRILAKQTAGQVLRELREAP